MKNKLSRIELINGVFIFLFGVQIVSQSQFWILPIDTSKLFGHASYILGSVLIFKSIFIIKINLYNKKIAQPHVDYPGFIIGISVLVYGAHVIQSGLLHSRSSWFLLSVEERYFAGLVLIFSGIFMVSRSYVLRKKHAR